MKIRKKSKYNFGRNKNLGSQREGYLVYKWWKKGYVVLRAHRSSGGAPLKIFKELFPDIYKRLNIKTKGKKRGKSVRPIDMIVVKNGKALLGQVSKYKDSISEDEIRVLKVYAKRSGSTPFLGWSESGRWEFYNAFTGRKITI